MDEVEMRLAKCFCSVFTGLSLSGAREATVDTVSEWDSINTVTLFAVLKEEYGVDVYGNDIGSMLSFKEILEYIRTRQPESAV